MIYVTLCIAMRLSVSPLQPEPHFDFNLKWGANTPIGCIAECHSVTTLT